MDKGRNEGGDVRWESRGTTCKSTIKEQRGQHASELAEGSGREFMAVARGGTSDGSPAVELAKAQ